MKKLLLLISLLTSVTAINAQTILCQDFSNSTTGWNTSNGSAITTYNNYNNACNLEYGIVTPGVGGNNPAKVLSEIITPNQQLIEVKFNIDRYNSNLTCNSHSDFGCPTSVDIIAVGSTYNGTNPVGDNAVIYSNNSGYLLPISGGTVSFVFSLPANLPPFKVFFNFSTSGNCNQGGTKYVIDKFCFTGYSNQCQVTHTCPPVAGNDYFNSGAQGFTNGTLRGNVYGTNLAYTPPAPNTAYTTRSLNITGISEDGGKDFDLDNHPLSQMTFAESSQSFTAADASLTFNADGTFSFLRLNTSIDQFFIYYTITDPTNLSDQGRIRIDYSSGAPLPVSLINFNVKKSASGAMLTWETAQESNNKGFDVLRKVAGNFEKIGFVASKASNGYSDLKLSYVFQDLNLPKADAVYYRLVQKDIDGKAFYSDIKIIKNGAGKEPLLIYPNPSHGDFQVTIPSDVVGFTDVTVYSASGSEVRSIKNNTKRQLDFKGLQSGIYMVKIFAQADNTIYTGKLIVQ